jgi:AcrR family transcriptional regulator
LEPRKTPVQARSAASVSAILEATIQVLLSVGKERLTTTRVAARAGVSVGTLYQYFPNKSALLQAVVKRHFSEITNAIEAVCHEQRGKSLPEMATALVTAFLDAKMKDVNTSLALCSVSGYVDAAKIVRQMGHGTSKAIAEMLESASEQMTADPQLVASMLQGTMAGVSRRLLESRSPEKRGGRCTPGAHRPHLRVPQCVFCALRSNKRLYQASWIDYSGQLQLTRWLAGIVPSSAGMQQP